MGRGWNCRGYVLSSGWEKVEDVQSSEIAIEGTTVCHKGAGRREETQPCCGVVVAAVRLRGGSGQGTRLLSSGFD